MLSPTKTRLKLTEKRNKKRSSQQISLHSFHFTCLTNQNLVRCIAHRNFHQDKLLKGITSPVSILVHENKHIPDKHTSNSGLGRCEFMEPTVFVTPVLSSLRVQATERPDLVSVDDLVKDLGKLLISNGDHKKSKDNKKSKDSDDEKASLSKDKSGHVI
ncbi:hypothetical protein FisN_25Lu086 [Fistulifera solaris]|uniref:Uncharacterized protein n=1 Tax=Fistulifera solaris TaxID=1519565 RepID=A0A1Z5KA13_FISSO|nr:hypothetical protein FisN_25Lu086 [Fistulifera solaris]|eukprot:GAX23099.1 hypothetical protein FisN_25Lu086 [Fistulifera solaris]